MASKSRISTEDSFREYSVFLLSLLMVFSEDETSLAEDRVLGLALLSRERAPVILSLRRERRGNASKAGPQQTS